MVISVMGVYDVRRMRRNMRYRRGLSQLNVWADYAGKFVAQGVRSEMR